MDIERLTVGDEAQSGKTNSPQRCADDVVEIEMNFDVTLIMPDGSKTVFNHRGSGK